jgi:hypothetical protein
LEFVPSGLLFLPRNLDFLHRPGAPAFPPVLAHDGLRRGSAVAAPRTGSAISARALLTVSHRADLDRRPSHGSWRPKVVGAWRRGPRPGLHKKAALPCL